MSIFNPNKLYLARDNQIISMRYLLAALFSSIFFLNALGQDFLLDVKVGGFEMESKEKTGRIINLSNGEIIIIRFNKKKKQLFITRYDKDFLFTEEITTSIGKGERLYNTIEFKDRLEIIARDYKEKEEYDLNTYSLYFETNDVIKKKLYTTKKVLGKRKFSWLESLIGTSKHRESFRVSPNGRFIAFLSDNVDIRTEAYGVVVFDEYLNKVYSQSHKGDTESYYELKDFIITDNAEVLFVGKRYEEGHKEKRKGDANYNYVLHNYTQDSFNSKVIDLGEDYFINDVGLVQSEGFVKIFGLYSEKDTKFVKGTVSYVFDNLIFDSLKVKRSPFSDAAFDDIYGEKKANRLSERDTEFKFYHLNHVLTDNLGNSYILGEQHWTKTRNIPGITGGGSEVIHYYGNILVVKLDNKGDQLWARNIFKKEEFTNYFPIVMDNQLHTILSSGRNLEVKSNDRKKVKTKFFEKMTLFDIAFDVNNGDYNFRNLQKNEKSYIGSFPISRSAWNGNRLLSGVIWKQKVGLLTISKKAD